MDVLSDVLNKIKVYEQKGKYECIVPSTKLIRSVLDTMQANNYIKNYEEIKEGKFSSLKINLSKKINDVGVIKPRHAVRMSDYQEYEGRYIPSKDFGILIVSTPKGIMTNRDAKAQSVGGRLLAYVY
jgi:small subunit ribosomal protein S8